MIEYCLNSVDAETHTRLSAEPASRAAPCLGHCGICCESQFAVVNGELQTIESDEDIVAISKGMDE